MKYQIFSSLLGKNTYLLTKKMLDYHPAFQLYAKQFTTHTLLLKCWDTSHAPIPLALPSEKLTYFSHI